MHVGERLLNWVEWVSVGGVVVTVLGFAGTIWALLIAHAQLRRVHTASIAASEAVATTQGQLRRTYSRLLLPQLVDIQQDLVSAAGTDDPERAHRAIDRWVRLAGQLQALLEEEAPQGTDLLDAVDESIKRSKRAKSAMVESGKSVLDATTRLRMSVGDVCGHVGRLESDLFRVVS
jgi:hypothetical protein